MEYPAIEIANKIISCTDTEHGETISNLKLQKLLYYLQGFFIAIFDKKLFKEKIEAWQYGPVVRDAYFHFNHFGQSAIELEGSVLIQKLKDKEEKLFREVMDVYGQFSAVKLMNMTHEELPWKSTFPKTPSGEISYDLMKKYFKTQIED